MRPQIELPADASDASQRRAVLALELARSCPAALADEIALVGSTARGAADDDSDLELNLWATAIPSVDERVTWLLAAGASDIQVEEAPRPDQSYWIGFRFGGIPGEIGWQTFSSLQAGIERIRSGSETERKALVFADVLANAIPLRTSGRLQSWQTSLDEYSDAVQGAIIRAAVERWSQPGQVAAARRLARHGERIALTQALLDDLDMALRVLYAVKRRWEPSRKWTLIVAREFAPDLPARIDAVLGDESLDRQVDLCARLCLDVLALVPEQYDAAAAVEVLREGLDQQT